MGVHDKKKRSLGCFTVIQKEKKTFPSLMKLLECLLLTSA